MDDRDDLLCTTCGHVGVPKQHTPGSMLIELVAWCAFLVPGLLYSLWRHSARVPVCRKCGGRTLLPLDAPMARRFVTTNQLTVPGAAEPGTMPLPRRPSPAAYAAGGGLGRLVGRALRATRRPTD